MMRVVFYIFYAIAWLVSLMPFWMLYGLSDFISFILYHVLGYRKKVVFENLKNAFPDKDERWIKQTAKKFYRSLSDIILENIKVLTIRQKTLAKRYQYNNTEIMDKIFAKEKSLIIAIGHNGNWEWLGNTLGPMYIHVKGYAIVKPLKNKDFDGFINGLRNRFIKDSIIYMKDTLRVLVKRKDITSLYVFAADQTPSPKNAYWAEFFNQDTPFYTGIEKLARTLDLGVIFIDLYREKRGHYVGDISLITESAKEMNENEITDVYIEKLEEAIKKRPHNWLWSHKRWKHKREKQA